jgi:GWxTD domain-containing protein
MNILHGVVVGMALMTPVHQAAAQAEMKPVRSEQSTAFFFDAICYESEEAGKSRIDVYIQVPYEQLRFVKDGEGFAAKYDVILTISRPTQQIVQERSWTVEVRLPEFARTVSRNASSLTQKALDIEPGEYRVAVQLKDQESKKGGRIQRSLLVTDFEKDSVSISDIMLVSRLTTEGEKRKIVPNISGNVSSSGEGFFLFFEVYRTVPMDSARLAWQIFNQEKVEIRSAVQEEALSGEKTQVFIKVEDLTLPVGTYLVTVQNRSGHKASSSRTFTVRWADMPASISDLKEAVEQLRYIAQPGEYDDIRNLETEEEMRTRFLEFWAKRDPDPGTPRNELMEEYYQRVEYANKTFSHYMDGWKTDRGMVYVRFGAPDNVERHPFDMNSKPYEVWYYYNIERQFVFVDETGFGDYRLRYPTTDLWGRVR